ncbi:NAD-dependent epimerase/dehydratase family protein [Chelativorans sp. YIM 93263]|uniref:NAD-dependent epimerase/dehydratase family protein n=1 Tax=Chelativorans sp. YIM 93263 TaxID=2906648 RepID=UPI002378D96F|nr:NAD(P)-dependent oxidoreductase [Chelativorans sp. YIM 93263]
MSKPRTIVSGGTGYVGRFIVEELLAAGHAVTVLGRKTPPPGFFSEGVGFHPLTLDPETASKVPFAGADFLVHAAFDHVQGKYRGGEGDDPDGFRRRNLDGTTALFEAAKAAGVRRSVFLSSRAVYGPRPRGLELHEDDEPKPDTLYGEVKLMGERALERIAGAGFEGVNLRVTGVYGPAGPGRAHKWAELFADYLAGRKIAPRAATEVQGEDVASAVRLVLETELLGETVFNLSDLIIDRRDLLAIVKRLTGAAHGLPEAGDKKALNVMNTERLRGLGWQPGGLELFEKTISRLLSHP